VAWGEPLWVFSGTNGAGLLRRGKSARRIRFKDPTAILRDLLKRAPVKDGPGAAGYFGYECARYFDKVKTVRSEGDDFVWALPRFWAVTTGGRTVLFDQARRGGVELARWAARLKAASAGAPARAVPRRPLRLGRNRGAYLRAVRRVKEYIAAGDIYQANISHRLDFPCPLDAAEPLFDALRRKNPSPYAALFRFPGRAVVSTSPELLLRARGERVETRPIAGTRPRGRNRAEDRRLSGELLLSAKERAEHVMLVDLERNDLGRVCRPGTVRVTERLALEKYSQVIHIVSHVRGRLKKGRDGLDAVRALFPGGTISGCPKIRCMEIIQELEREPRGIFYGSAGVVGFNGDVDLNILIRTALLEKGRLSLRVGAGIVADSDPAREYDETLHKARALTRAYESLEKSA